MIYLIYLLLVPVSLLITLVAVLLAPLMVLFGVVEKEGWLDNHSRWGVGPRLIDDLNWFMTPDNSLDGDATFEKLNGTGYLAKVKWLLRNPAYSFALKYLHAPYEVTVKGDTSIKDNNNAKAGICFVTANGLFQFRYIKRIGSTNRCILVNFGWNIMALVDDNVQPKPNPYQATFVFSPRISGFR